ADRGRAQCVSTLESCPVNPGKCHPHGGSNMSKPAKKLDLLLAVVLAVGALPAHAARFINVLTGGTSGVYYPLGVALTQIYGKALPDAKVSVQATKASAENLNLLQSGRGEIA